MTDTQASRLDIDELMKRVRREVELRRAGRDLPVGGAAAGEVATPETHVPLARSIVLPRLAADARLPAPKDEYGLAELLAPHDLDFVRAAYVAVLGREPEPEVALLQADKLRTGALTKVELLGNLRFSPEGRANRVRVRGLVLPYALQQMRRIPLVGHLLEIGIAILRLPTHLRSVQRLESHVFRQQREHGTVFDQLAATAESSLQGVTGGLAAALDEQAAQRRALEAANARIDALREGMVWRAELDHLRAVMDTLERAAGAAREHGARIGTIESRLGAVDSVKAAVDALGAGADALSARVEAAERRCDAFDQLSTRADAVASELAALRAELAADRAAQPARLEAAMARVNAVEQAVTQLRGEADAARSADRADIDAALAAGAGLNEAIQAVWSRFAEIDGAKPGRDEFEALGARIASELAGREGSALEGRVEAGARELAAHRRNLLDLDRRLVAGLEALAPRRGVTADARAAKAAGEARHRLDAFYAEFEERFRGTRDEIKARARFYLPVIERAGAGLPDAGVLDIGCGRGEWLELLKESGRLGYGVDLNRVFVEECRERGLDVREAEALEHLRALPANSLGAITAMHVVEHIDFETLVAFFDECLRVLRPGGVVAFETPNPENLQTAAYYFYYDPTHRNPLPPPLLHFIAEARGFVDAEIHRLGEARGFTPPPPVGADAPNAQELERVLDLLRPAPDYALVARKT